MFFSFAINPKVLPTTSDSVPDFEHFNIVVIISGKTFVGGDVRLKSE